MFGQLTDRVLKRWQFWLAIVIGFLIVIIQNKTTNPINANTYNSAFLHMTGFEDTGLGNQLYFLLIPLTIGIAVGSIYQQDKNGKMQIFAFTRKRRKFYFRRLLANVFLFSGLIGMVPLLVEAIFYFSKYHIAVIPQSQNFQSISNSGWGYHLFLQQPLIFWLLSLIIIFVFSGFLGLSSILASYFDLKYGLETVVPFCLVMASIGIADTIGKSGLAINRLMSPLDANDYSENLFFIIGYLVLGSLVTVMLTKWEESRDSFA